MKIKFPIISYLDNIFSVDKGLGFKAIRVSFPDKNTMICMECERNSVPGWIIASSGNFIELKPSGKKREWTRPLSFLTNMVLSQYVVAEGRSITVGELKMRMKSIKDKFPEAPLAEDFRIFLDKYKNDVVVSENILLDWPI